MSLDIDLSNADTTIAKHELRVASDGFSVDGFSADFGVNCTHASSVLTNVKGTKKKPKIVQETLAELQERFDAAVAAAPQLDLATCLRKFLKDVKKCLEGIIDEMALEVMSVALEQAHGGATLRPEFWELVQGPVQDSYTPLSALYTQGIGIGKMGVALSM